MARRSSCWLPLAPTLQLGRSKVQKSVPCAVCGGQWFWWEGQVHLLEGSSQVFSSIAPTNASSSEVFWSSGHCLSVVVTPQPYPPCSNGGLFCRWA